MNRQRRLIMRLRCLVHAVLQLGTALAVCLLTAVTTNAQQITGVGGSPDATVTLDRKQLPPPPMPFGGVIKESAKDSTPYWSPRVVPPKGDTRTAVNDDYKLPFRFTGTISKLTFKLGPSQLLPTDQKAAEDAAKSVDN